LRVRPAVGHGAGYFVSAGDDVLGGRHDQFGREKAVQLNCMEGPVDSKMWRIWLQSRKSSIGVVRRRNILAGQQG
jgi:hypothetical protein